MSNKTNVARIRTTTAAAASDSGAFVDVTDALQDIEALITTAMRSLGADSDGDSPEEVTLGLALQRLRVGMERVRAMRAPTTKD